MDKNPLVEIYQISVVPRPVCLTLFVFVCDLFPTFFSICYDHPGIIPGPSGDHPGTFFRLFVSTCSDHPGIIWGPSGDHPGTFFQLFPYFVSTFLRPSGDHPGTTQGSSGTPPVGVGGGGPPGPSLLSAPRPLWYFKK